MPHSPDQVLTVAQMRAAEQALIDAGTSVEALMDTAGKGAAEWVWRLAAHRPVTVLCGPGNNGGDGYVIAEAVRTRGGQVTVIAAAEPATEAARNARALFRGDVLGPEVRPLGDVLVDCLFGSGLTRPLTPDHAVLLADLARSHRHLVAVDLPSGIDSDTGAALNAGLPTYDLTIALGAWKFAHFLMPASAKLGVLRLVAIGIAPVAGAARRIGRPQLSVPAEDVHKYRRGLLGVVAGEMPGAGVMACIAAQGAGAGYVKLLGEGQVPLDIVEDRRPLAEALGDKRLNALLVGPGLGRGAEARGRLSATLASRIATVADADALVLLQAGDPAPDIVTPHEGELAMLEQTFGLSSARAKPELARALARASRSVVVAKGPDTLIAAPNGRLAFTPRASSWLSTAGTGDVLAGTIASRLATGLDPFEAACQGVWLHAEAARLCRGPFTAEKLAHAISEAYRAAL